MAYDDRAAAMAARMLAPKPRGKGQVVTLVQPGAGGTFDPATDATTGGSAPIEHQGSGVEEAYSSNSIDGRLIQAGDVKLMLSPVKLDGSSMPMPVADSWMLTKSDGDWAVKRVDRTAPAGLVAMYVLQLRRMGG